MGNAQIAFDDLTSIKSKEIAVLRTKCVQEIEAELGGNAA
jgi:hypothetical protein